MRVLITADAVGGVWTFAQELTEGLLDAGCAVSLACVGPAPSQAQQGWVRRMQSRWAAGFAFNCVAAPLEWMQQNEAAFDGACQTVLQLAAEFQADVIHSSQFCFGALETSLPVVVTAHSDVLSWAAACRDQPLEPDAWLQRYIHLAGRGLERARAVTAPTRWMLQAVAAGFPLAAQQCVIPNGRTLPPIAAAARRLQAVSCGRLWDEGKNVALLGRIDSPLPILVAGSTAGDAASAPAEMRGVQMLGSLGEAELLALFRRSSVYICTSRYEPFGLAPLEAALCGCAVLLNDIAPLREVWEDAALYFEDEVSLTRQLARFAAGPALLAEYQRRAHQRAGRFNRQTMTGSYLSLYRRQLCRPPRAHAA